MLAVLFHHALFTTIHPSDWPAAYHAIIALSHFAQYGLDLFFVLSGYLITTILIENKDKPRYYRDFYVNRLTRIIPIYAIVLIGVATFVPGSKGYVILSALFVVNFAQLFGVGSFGPFWTLAIEEQFYIVWPTLVRLCSKGQLKWLAQAILVVEPILRLSDIAIGHHNFQFTFFHADGLTFGALLALQGGRLAIGRTVITLAAGVVLYAASLREFGNGHLDAVFEALQLTSVSMMAYALIALAVESGDNWPTRWLGTPVLIFFGQISYCFYLIHLYIFRAFDAEFGPADGVYPQYILVRFAVVLMMTTLLCIVSQKFIERPALALRKRLV